MSSFVDKEFQRKSGKQETSEPANFKGPAYCFAFDVEPYHHVTLTVHTLKTNKAADSEEFVFGDNLEAILDILEADEDIEREFLEAVDEVKKDEVTCEFCNKKCKSIRGLKRHITMKHDKPIPTASEPIPRQQEEESSTNTSMTTDVLVVMVDDVKLKLLDNLIYNESKRDEIKAYSFNKPAEESEEFSVIKGICMFESWRTVVYNN
ncbi:uncharacterized protein LOC116290505 [Actinia tenebrosa]|uniref:Uncharacterized protein LOC116290505 n=1 Tax=Actinia tenebrosa TaxID=6105 RepID=A0A6P8HEG4_ACTTE|nr:uncharacterized protein LOC116290505 [Actinia tenebrosa]